MTRLLSGFAKDLINCKDIVVEDVKFEPAGKDVVPRFIIQVRPKACADNRCPICGRKCRKDGNSTQERLWRHVDVNGVLVYVMADTHRIECPEHGSRIADVPWAYAGSYFTRDFDRMAAALARELPKTFVAELLRIDWHTVGRCVSRTLNDLEPDRSKRLVGLKRIIVDETSYRKGHKYITVVLNAETSEVVWVHLNHGKEVFEKFCKLLTEEQRAAIEIVAGDGAKWIDSCTEAYFPIATRCVDPFHVVTWAMEALDNVRLEAWRNARTELCKLEREKDKIVADAKKRGNADEPSTQDAKDKEPASGSSTADQGEDSSTSTPRRKGPAFTPEEQEQMELLNQRIQESKKDVSKYKGSTFALGKAPDHLTENQKVKLEIIAKEDQSLYQAYILKERLRLLLKMDADEGREELAAWITDASCCEIGVFRDLASKILRHSKNIVNFMETGISSAPIEATNSKIKLAIRKARGFRNTDSMMDMVYFVCSNIVVPRPHGGSFPRAYSSKGLFRHHDDVLDQDQELIA